MSAARAAPEVTVARMNERSMPVTRTLSLDLVGCCDAGPLTSIGACQLPESTAPATRAISSGLTRTVPLPTVSPASSRWLVPGLAMAPVNAGIGSRHGTPMPSFAASAVRLRGESPYDRPVKAVLQACAKSVLRSGPEPRLGSGGMLEKVCPPTRFVLLHGAWVLNFADPVVSMAAVETIVKVCPGSYCPLSGFSSGIPRALCRSAARILPLPALIATMVPETPRPDNALCAAAWTRSSIDVLTLELAAPSHRCRILIGLPALFCTMIEVVGLPASFV